MRRLINLTITALVTLAAVAGPAAAHMPNDVSYASPDARDSARQVSTPQTDLRSPDARDSATRPVSTYAPGHISQPSPVVSPVVTATTGGFDWADAGIGAAAMLALLACASGALLVASHRRRDRAYRVATR